MKPIVRNILAVVLGLVIGGVANMTLIEVGMNVIPPPEGVDMKTPEGLAEGMKLLTPANFIMVFLAHAVGTLFGAYVAAKVAASHQGKFAMVIAVFFLMGGIAMIAMVGGPVWFRKFDLIFAYIPMGALGYELARTRITPPVST